MNRRMELRGAQTADRNNLAHGINSPFLRANSSALIFYYHYPVKTQPILIIRLTQQQSTVILTLSVVEWGRTPHFACGLLRH
jgi:hypothetical protein